MSVSSFIVSRYIQILSFRLLFYISLLVAQASKRIGLAGTPQFSGFATVLMDRSKGWTMVMVKGTRF